MLSLKKMEERIALVLMLGTLLSAFLVLIGAVLYLFQSGQHAMQSEISPSNITPITINQIWQLAFSLSPLGIIELGLLSLVATQTIRVALLCWFYAMIRDYKFLMISFFILVVLIYSSFWRS